MEPTQNNTPTTNSQYFNNSIFWIEVEKIVPNPYQPRREFDQHALKDLSESIRMYGLLQPLVVTRKEMVKADGGLAVQYELISGERRLRASKLAGLVQVPVIIRAGEEDARVKLELAIIENLQREDLNPVDRARSFQRLAEEFGLKHSQIAEKMGKSREYVTNSIRLLSLPEHILTALSEKKISEGHTRPLLMLVDRPEEQETLFKEIVFKKITVREAESIARRVAVERTRKKDASLADPEIREFETKLNQALGTRVMIEKREQGGKVVIDFFSNEDLRHLLDMIEKREQSAFPHSIAKMSVYDASVSTSGTTPVQSPDPLSGTNAESTISVNQTNMYPTEPVSVPNAFNIASSLNTLAHIAEQHTDTDPVTLIQTEHMPSDFGLSGDQTLDQVTSYAGHAEGQVAETPVDDSTPNDAKEDEDLYSIKNFSI